jgi:predicted transcriptional regulator YdeE
MCEFYIILIFASPDRFRPAPVMMQYHARQVIQQRSYSMQPTRQTLTTPPTITGIAVRTTNMQELNPLTAKIAGLWGRFFSEALFEKIPDRSDDPCVYGVYSAYESDYMGAFDVTAGVAVSRPAADASWSSIEIQAGEYLVFTARGAMPQTVVQAWGGVWQYFQAHPEIQRSYGTDFEVYQGLEEVAIHIGVRA